MIKLDAKELDDLDASCEAHHSRGWRTKDNAEKSFIVQVITKIPKLTAEIRELRSTNSDLLAALESVVKFAQEAHAKWDSDQDMRVGKMLTALSGWLPRYRPETDAIHAAIHNAKSDDPS